MDTDPQANFRDLYMQAAYAADTYSDKTFLIHYRNGIDNDPDIISYRCFYEKLNQTINWLQSIGVGEGDVVAYILPNIPELPLINIAAQTVGIGVCIEMWSEPAMVAGLINTVDPKVLIVFGPDPDVKVYETYRSIESDIIRSPKLVYVDYGNGSDTVAQTSTFDYCVSGQAKHPLEKLPDNPDRVIAYYLTGGTTARPKLVVRTAEGFYHSSISPSLQSVRAQGMGPDSVKFFFVPAYAAVNNMHSGATFLLLGTQDFMHPVTQLSISGLLLKHGVTNLTMAPSLVPFMERTPGFADVCQKSLKVVQTVGGKLNAGHIETLKAMGVDKIVDFYGTTESGVIAHKEIIDASMAGCIGHMWSGVDARVLDFSNPDAVVECGDDEIGELAIRSQSVFDSYFLGEAVSNRFGDGWYLTGDLARRDGQGEYWLLGRSERSARNIGSSFIDIDTIEPLVEDYADVDTLAVVPIYTGSGAVVLAMFVCPKPGCYVQEQDFLEYCREVLNMLSPTVMFRMFLMSDLPYGSRGKVDRRALQRLALRSVIAEQLQQTIAGYSFKVQVDTDKKSLYCLTISVKKNNEVVEVNDEFSKRIDHVLVELPYRYTVE